MPMNQRLLRPRQTTHPEAADWASRVRANGSYVSGTTLVAVSKFCQAIDSAGIRSRFYRLNLFCGGAGSSDSTRLNACLVPLYRGPSLGGAQYGGTTDTNAGGAAAFITTDFTELGSGGGLQGNGTKYLNTGLAHNTLPQDDSHIACYEIARASATFRVSVGCRASPTTGNLILGTWSSTANYTALAFQSSSNLSLASSAGGFYLCSVNGSANTALYRNGGGKVTTTATTRTPSSQNVFVFALNDAGNVSVPTDARLGGYSLGLRLTDAETAAFNTAMQAFQTALGRNV